MLKMLFKNSQIKNFIHEQQLIVAPFFSTVRQLKSLAGGSAITSFGTLYEHGQQIPDQVTILYWFSATTNTALVFERKV